MFNHFNSRRKKRQARVTSDPAKSLEQLQTMYDEVFDTAELAKGFIITSIIPPDVVVVRRKADNVVGTMRYQNEPRFYFGFVPQKTTE